MALPINIEELINGNTVEWERIEFRKGWNLPTILKELAKNKSPKPVFETDEERSYFKTTFFIHPEFKEEGEGVKEDTPQVTPKVDRDLKLKFESLLHREGVNEGVNEGVKKRLIEEIIFLKNNHAIKRVDIEKIFKVSKATAERDIAFLKKLGLIEFIGAPKIGKYVITEKGKKFFEGKGNE